MYRAMNDWSEIRGRVSVEGASWRQILRDRRMLYITHCLSHDFKVGATSLGDFTSNY